MPRIGNRVRRSELAKSLDTYLLVCAAAATAVFPARSAEAVVQYSGLLDIPVNHTTESGIYIDLNGLTVGTSSSAVPGWDANFFNNLSPTDPDFASVLLYFPPGNATNTAAGENLPLYAYTSRLGAGVTVGPGSNFHTIPATYPFGILAYHDNLSYDQSQWNGGVTDGFVGIRFSVGVSVHFAWARLNIEPFNSPTPYRITLRDFAFQDQPNTPIGTGEGIPEPSALALGLLALGAAAYRPRRS